MRLRHIELPEFFIAQERTLLIFYKRFSFSLQVVKVVSLTSKSNEPKRKQVRTDFN